MNLPKTDKPEKYVGLYAVDFGESASLGYTAREVATLLESEKFSDVKVYKVYRAMPDGSMEINGVSNERFQLESGLFFYGLNLEDSEEGFNVIKSFGESTLPPCPVNMQLAQGDQISLIALIYPAEYDNEVGDWLNKSGFKGRAAVDAGVSQVQRYVEMDYEIIERHQLWPQSSLEDRSFAELLDCVGLEFQR